MTLNLIGTGQTYTTIAAWISATPSNLVSTTQTWEGEMLDEDFAEDGLLIGSGVTTSATYFIRLRAQNSLARTGTGFTPLVKNSGPRIRPTGALNTDAGCIGLRDTANHIILEDFEIDLDAYTSRTSGNAIGIRTGDVTGSVQTPELLILRRILVWGWSVDTTTGVRGFILQHNIAATTDHKIAAVRCVAGGPTTAHTLSTRGFYSIIKAATDGCEINHYNCTAQGFPGSFGYGFISDTEDANGTIRIENCLGIDNGTDFDELDGTGTVTWNNNVSEDLTADDEGGTGHQTGATAADEVRTLDSDWHYGEDGVAWDNGKDLSGLTLGGWDLDVEVDPNGGTFGSPYDTDQWSSGADSQGYVVESIKSGGDYTTVGAWNSALPTTADSIMIGEMGDEDFAESGLLIGNGVTTDATRYVVLRAENSDARTGSVFNVLEPNSGPRVRPTGANPSTVSIIEPDTAYVIFEDFEITQAAYTGTPTGIIWGLKTDNSSCVRFLGRRLLAVGHDLGGQRSDGMAFIVPASSRYRYGVRCVGIDCGPSGSQAGRGLTFDAFSGGSGQVNVEAYNCLADNNDNWGISFGTTGTAGVGGKVKARNCVGMRTLDADSDISYTGGGGTVFTDHDHANHASEDNSADDYGCTDAIEGITPDSEILTLGSDYHLEPTAPDCLGSAVDVSGLTTAGPDGWNLLVEIDPDGENVAGSWDRGPDNHGHQAFPLPKRPINTLLRM
jgi:hypothetical protein